MVLFPPELYLPASRGITPNESSKLPQENFKYTKLSFSPPDLNHYVFSVCSPEIIKSEMQDNNEHDDYNIAEKSPLIRYLGKSS